MKGFLLLIVAAVGSLVLSCKKPGPPKAVIKTLDTLYKPVANVTVRVYAQPNGSYVDPIDKTIELKDKTDANGTVTFEFRNEAILNVEAKQTNPNRQASGMIFLENGKTTEKTLILR
ncbi:MAG: DUF4198 domain-containing protein [Bacteroidales bacterium]|nr:DUF4198 domain-containing protein [Bacteroidales bacterium]